MLVMYWALLILEIFVHCNCYLSMFHSFTAGLE